MVDEVMTLLVTSTENTQAKCKKYKYIVKDYKTNFFFKVLCTVRSGIKTVKITCCLENLHVFFLLRHKGVRNTYRVITIITGLLVILSLIYVFTTRPSLWRWALAWIVRSWQVRACPKQAKISSHSTLVPLEHFLWELTVTSNQTTGTPNVN